jgi:hypothetical protein
MISDKIKEAVRKYYTKKLMAVFFELGLTRAGSLRADVLAISMKGQVVVVEVKSSVRDFLTDKKYLKYSDFCNKLYLAMTLEVYKEVQDKIPKGVGLFLLNNNYQIIKVRPAKSRTLEPGVAQNLAIRACFRSSDFSTRKNKCSLPTR